MVDQDVLLDRSLGDQQEFLILSYVTITKCFVPCKRMGVIGGWEDPEGFCFVKYTNHKFFDITFCSGSLILAHLALAYLAPGIDC